MLGLYCCTRASSSYGERGLLSSYGVRASHCGGVSWAQVLGARASGAAALWLSSCGSRAWLLRGTWNLPRLEIKPVSPALAGRVLSTVPPRKSQDDSFYSHGQVEPHSTLVHWALWPQTNDLNSLRLHFLWRLLSFFHQLSFYWFHSSIWGITDLFHAPCFSDGKNKA